MLLGALNPAYTGPRLFVNNTNNAPPFGGGDLDIHRRIIDQQPHLVIQSGWWGITNVNGVDQGERSLGALAGAIGPRVRRKLSRLV